jgi:hypothetical protein
MLSTVQSTHLVAFLGHETSVAEGKTITGAIVLVKRSRTAVRVVARTAIIVERVEVLSATDITT